MITNKPNLKPTSYHQKKTKFIDKQFQLKYISLILVPFTLVIIAMATPIYYFWNENYKIFIDLAYMQAPTLVEHLQRENTYIHLLLIIIPISSGLFFYIMGTKITSKVIAPVKLIKNHLYNLARGRWHIRPLKIRDDDEFQELVDIYNYFYKSFQNNIEKDLERIKRLNVDPADRDAYKAWQQLMQEKLCQLNKTSEAEVVILNDEVAKQSHDQRHVS